MNIELFNRIEELFLEKLSRKTGWGKNELKDEWKDAKIQALTEALNGEFSFKGIAMSYEDLQKYVIGC